MRYKAISLPFWAALFILFALPALGAQKNVTLSDFSGTWQLDATRSKESTKDAAGKLRELTGFKFTINARAKTIRMEWPGHQPKVRKVLAAEADGQAISCQLEGYKARMRLEKVAKDEIRVVDRDEALVFVRLTQ